MLTRLGAIVAVAGAVMLASAGGAAADSLGSFFYPQVTLSIGSTNTDYKCGGDDMAAGPCPSSNDLDGPGSNLSYTLGASPSVTSMSTNQSSVDISYLDFWVEDCVPADCSGAPNLTQQNVTFTYSLSMSQSDTTGPPLPLNEVPGVEAFVAFDDEYAGSTPSVGDFEDYAYLAGNGQPGPFEGLESDATETLLQGTGETIATTMLENTPYEVQIEVARASNGGDNASLSVSVGSSGGGVLVFSDGVGPTEGVPEPGSLTLFGAALFGLGAVRRRWKRL